MTHERFFSKSLPTPEIRCQAKRCFDLHAQVAKPSRDTSSALRNYHISTNITDCVLTFSDEISTHHTILIFMKVHLQKKQTKK